jgi:acyl-CoA synthetase (AMP-forming)/AMP-acid ligase II
VTALGETALALVCLHEGAGITEDDVVQARRERLGSYKKPTAGRLSTDRLRRTPLGKISRKALREPYWAGRDQRLGAT